jgi:hypothetical protein
MTYLVYVYFYDFFYIFLEIILLADFIKKRTFRKINSQDNCWHVFGARCRIIYKWRKGFYRNGFYHTIAQGVLLYYYARGTIILLREGFYHTRRGKMVSKWSPNIFGFRVVTIILSNHSSPFLNEFQIKEINKIKKIKINLVFLRHYDPYMGPKKL